jgi:hypothetical protein
VPEKRGLGWPLTNVPWGLCGNRKDHDPHMVTDSAVCGVFYCTARQSDRLPYSRERKRGTDA